MTEWEFQAGELPIKALLRGSKSGNQKDKTDQQLNRTLAELMGYKVVDLDPDWIKTSRKYVLAEPEERQQLIRHSEDEAWEDAPDYCNDPAASLEVQAKAIEVDAELYMNKLAFIKGVNVQYVDGSRNHDDGWYIKVSDAALIANASPREMAEAAYITLSSVK